MDVQNLDVDVTSMSRGEVRFVWHEVGIGISVRWMYRSLRARKSIITATVGRVAVSFNDSLRVDIAGVSASDIDRLLCMSLWIGRATVNMQLPCGDYVPLFGYDRGSGSSADFSVDYVCRLQSVRLVKNDQTVSRRQLTRLKFDHPDAVLASAAQWCNERNLDSPFRGCRCA